MRWPDNILDRMQLPGSPVQLAVLRIAIGLQVFYAVNSKIFGLLLAVGERQHVHTILPARVEDLLAAHAIPGLVLACKVLSIGMVLGLFTRVVVPLLTGAFLLLFAYYYMGVNAPIHWLYLWFPLVVLSFGGSGHVLSVDAMVRRRAVLGAGANDLHRYRWPVELMVGWFAYIYFAAGLAKVFPVIKGMAWLNGQTSKEIMYDRFLESPLHYLFDAPLFDYAGAETLYILLTISAVLLELFTVVLLFTTRFHMLVLVLITLMHWFLYLVGVAGFAQTALVLGIALVSPAAFRRFDERCMRRPAAAR